MESGTCNFEDIFVIIDVPFVAVIKSILDAKTAETDGVLSIDELGDCLEAFGFNADDEDVTFLQKHFDDNGT